MDIFDRQKAQFIREADDYLHGQGLLPADRSLASTGHNDQLDAFRHAYVSGRFAHAYGGSVATLMGDFHEWRNPNDRAEQQMDMHNNRTGIGYARDARTPEALLDRVMQGVRNGELIVQPGQTPNPVEGGRYGAALDVPGMSGTQMAQLGPEERSKLREFLTGRDHAPFLEQNDPAMPLVASIEQQLDGRGTREEAVRLAAVLRPEGFERVDHLSPTEQGWVAVQGNPSDPAKLRETVTQTQLAALDTGDAARQLQMAAASTAIEVPERSQGARSLA